MSRFTRPPFHKPSPFDIPRPVHPLSPPETEITATESVNLPPMSIVSRDTAHTLGSFIDVGGSSAFTRVDTPESYHTASASMDTQAHSHAQSQSQSQSQSQNGRERFRPRPSNLGYLHHPGLGSVRSDNININIRPAAPRSATRWLVMVIPPPAIAREHGHGRGMFLNHTASSRSGEGVVLLPLLPSLSGQLSAIAREFAFPSTSGIVVYLHMAMSASDGCMQFAPRISDESWSILWGACFDDRERDRQQSMHTMGMGMGMGGLPIAGRIEFDLDLRKARWFDMWLSSIKRNSVDMGSSSAAGHSGPGTFGGGNMHMGHRREESRTTMFDHTEDSAQDDVSVTIQRKVPVVRHVPRKLSLLDRVDASTIKPSPRLGPGPASRVALSPTDAEHQRLVLSPVAQTPIATVPMTLEDETDEPQTATATVIGVHPHHHQMDISKKVESWRASSSFAKSPLVASTGQTALDPTNMPNDQPLVETDVVAAADAALEPLNLDDFTWSITSAGPLSADYRLPVPVPLFVDTERSPSVHLDARLEGSVCLTPTTCTSFGPPEYDLFSPVASPIDRLPSPDIASRQFEDCPPTPSTATSWGPPLEYPESPYPESLFRAPSVDIAMRQLGSRPVTPSTATSWGAPLSWPVSPPYLPRAPSVDLGARELGSWPVTPSTATSWGAPLDYPPSPAVREYVQTPGVGSMFFDGLDEESNLLGRGRGSRVASYGAGGEEPYSFGSDEVVEKKSPKPWKFVWPYRQASSIDSDAQRTDLVSVSVCVQPKYPCISLYPPVYPHFDLYPAPAASVIKTASQPPRKQDLQSAAPLPDPPKSKPWKHVWPYQKVVDNVLRPINIKVGSTYPSFNLYPAVYPYFDLYPARPRLTGTTKEAIVRLEPTYPRFNIYPAVYPNFEIYPGHVVDAQSQKDLREVSVRLEAKYPCIRLYSAVYPYFELYPALPVVKSRSSETKGSGRKPPTRMALPSHDETSQVHKAAPWKHVWPYQRAATDVGRPVNVRLFPRYPSFDLYPAVYPHFDLYPTKPSLCGSTQKSSIKLSATYPAFSIYPAVYPNFEIYPGHVVGKQGSPRELMSVKLKSKYPALEIYQPVYPHLMIYPGVVAERKRPVATPPTSLTRTIADRNEKKQDSSEERVPASQPISVTLQVTYPNLDIYPAVYPYFDIYRSGVATTPEYSGEPRPVTLRTKYPVIEIYPPVYPYFDIYKSGHASDPTPLINRLSTRLETKYPAFNIYPAIYPNFELYPSVRPVMQAQSCRRRARKTHQELVDIVLAQSRFSRRVPSISISSYDAPQRQRRRSHKELVELVFPPSAEVPEVPSRVRESAPAPARRPDVLQDVGSSDSPRRTASRQSHIPVRPSEIRRSVSLREGTMSSSFVTSRTQSPRHSLSIRGEGAGSRVAAQRQLYGSSNGHTGERKPMKRDSIVLERARQWGAADARPTQTADSPSRVSMKDLSEFPMPPLPSAPPVPSVSTLPNGRLTPSNSSTNRPSIAKLDKTKFPFR